MHLSRPLAAIAAIVLIALLNSCTTRAPAAPGTPVAESRTPPARPATPAPLVPPAPVATGTSASTPSTAIEPDYRAWHAAEFAQLPGWQSDALDAAWPALQQSCQAIGNRPLWQPECRIIEALGATPSGASVRQFLRTRFRPWQIRNPDGSTRGMVTGYYEPLITGRAAHDTPTPWPIYGVPDDLIDVELGSSQPDLQGRRLRGRLDGQTLNPYWTRRQIRELGTRLPAEVLAWADDPIELFFLQVQGSGRVQLRDGSLLRIGYADHNGHPYRSIGRWLIDQGELTLPQASMQGIQAWAATHPKRLNELLDQNPAFVFFRILPSHEGGPIGALGVPLTAERSIAIDPRYVPLGAPVWLDTTRPLSDEPLQQLVVAQDTGSAIKGAVRADFFWGFGAEAGQQAGRMRQDGQVWVLMPRSWSPTPPAR